MILACSSGDGVEVAVEAETSVYRFSPIACLIQSNCSAVNVGEEDNDDCGCGLERNALYPVVKK
jgi:hypothetical protein